MYLFDAPRFDAPLRCTAFRTFPASRFVPRANFLFSGRLVDHGESTHVSGEGIVLLADHPL